MGFTLFTSSATFVPGNYGLNPSDTIHICVVGGGGGGGGAGYNGSSYVASNAASGGSSSFGSYLTAVGGAAGTGGTTSTSTPGAQSRVGGSLGTGYASLSTPYYTGSAISTLTVIYGGAGGNGWLPNVGIVPAVDLFAIASQFVYPVGKSLQMPIRYGQIVPIIYSTSSTQTTPGGYNGGDNSSASTDQMGGIGSGQSNRNNWGAFSANVLYVLGPGGVGYGAGGGGGIMPSDGSFGGNAGEVKHLDYVLTSSDMSGIAVTVGNGGKGSNSGSTSYFVEYGGGGAKGCVAIWW